MPLKDDVQNWNPMFIGQSVADSGGHIVTADQWNNYWNLVRTQGDDSAQALHNLRNLLFETIYAAENAAENISFSYLDMLATNVSDALKELETMHNADVLALQAHWTSNDHDGRYLAKGNTVPFDPTLPYEPCTLKKLNDTAAGITQGAVPDGSITDIKLGANNKVGSLAALLTTAKSSVVAAINELYNRPTEPVDGSVTNTKLAADVKVGSLAALQTTEKGSVVGAINELKNSTPAGVVTETGVQSLSNKTMVAMRVTSGGKIDDASGNELFEFPVTVSGAVNHVRVSNAATGSGPKLEVSGGDTNADLSLGGKGTGSVKTLTQPLSATCVRNITISTSDPSGGSAGDIWLKYTP